MNKTKEKICPQNPDEILSLLSRERAESAVGTHDCSGKPYEDWVKEDMIRFFLEGAEAQRDNDVVKIGRVSIADMYSLDWKQILHKAIQSRPTSWRVEDPVAEYRNASDCIAQQVIQEMKNKGFIGEK